jgi:hypothetical protein
MTTVKYLLFSDLYPGRCPTTTINSTTSVNAFLTDVMKGRTFSRNEADVSFYNGSTFVPLSRDKEAASSFNASQYSAISSSYGVIVEKGVPILEQLQGQDVSSGVFYVNFFNQKKDENAAKKCLGPTGGRRRRTKKSCKRKGVSRRRRGTRRRGSRRR